MLKKEISQIKSGPKEIKSFARLVGTILLLLGIFLIWKQNGGGIPLLVVGVLLWVVSQLAPNLLKPAQKAWMILALMMGWVMSRVILTIFFCLMVTPIGIVLKLMRKDLLDARIDKRVKSYWKPKEIRELSPEDFEKQY
jgi:hypothetical protein